MAVNSCQKGKRGERAWRDELRAEGFEAKRGQQHAGGADSPDVICPSLPQFHFEVKCVEALNVQKAYDQAERDGVGKMPVVAHKRSRRNWLVTISASTFFALVREFIGGRDGQSKE